MLKFHSIFKSSSFVMIKWNFYLSICFAKIKSLQRHVLSLDGPVVTASGFQDQLAVVTHVSECLSSNDQVDFDIVRDRTLHVYVSG